MKKRLPFPAVFCVVQAVSLFCFGWLRHYDNKYTWPGQRAQNGLLTLTEADLSAQPFVYLAGGWEYFSGYHAPQELTTPDRVLYLGQFGGFELDDPAAEPRGSATYRLTIEAPAGTYLLELPEIYSAYRLWVNGVEARAVGEPDPAVYRAATDSSALTLAIDGRAEIVVAVTNYTSFYSGMIYPPAFGTTEAVGHLLTARLILHSVFCAAAFLVGLFCLILGLRQGRGVFCAFFALLCFFVIGMTAYPLIHAMGFSGGGWYLWEKISLYGMLFALCELAGRLCAVPRRIRAAAFAVGLAICALVACFLLLPCAWDGTAMRFYSGVLAAYQWTAAAYLLTVSGWAVLKNRYGSRTLLCGVGIYGCAIAVQKLGPIYEPARTGWPVEFGGIALVLLLAGILLSESLRLWRVGLEATATLAIHQEQAAMLTRQAEATAKRSHEVQRSYALLKYYEQEGKREKLVTLLATLCEEPMESGIRCYTVHSLLNAVLTVKLTRAGEKGIRVEQEIIGIPAQLSMEDAHLCSLVANLLDNAIEGCTRLPEETEKFLLLGLRYEGGVFSVIVKNTAAQPQGRTAKRDGGTHGFGLSIISGIVEKYGGTESAVWEDGIFRHSVALFLA